MFETPTQLPHPVEQLAVHPQSYPQLEQAGQSSVSTRSKSAGVTATGWLE